MVVTAPQAAMWRQREGFTALTSTFPKKDRYQRLHKYRQGSVSKKTLPSESEQTKSVVLVCSDSVQTPALCKCKTKLHKYLCDFRESHIRKRLKQREALAPGFYKLKHKKIKREK